MDCVFCNILKETNNPLFIHQFSMGTVYLNNNQLFHGRILYILHDHWDDVSEVPQNIYEEANRDIYLLIHALKFTLQTDLINVAILCNQVKHAHWHIIPRYKDDPCWENPPWPHGEKLLQQEDSEALRERIRKAITSYITL